jgi:hypothetical protein
MESRGCGVLGHPLSRVMTAGFAAGAAATFLPRYPSFTLASSASPATKNSTSTAMVFTGGAAFPALNLGCHRPVQPGDPVFQRRPLWN